MPDTTVHGDAVTRQRSSLAAPKVPRHTEAGPVTVTKPDGTVEVRRAYRPEELDRITTQRRQKATDGDQDG